MIRVRVRKKGRKFLTLFYVDPVTGKEVAKSARTNDPKEAERAAAKWEMELVTSRGVDGCGWEYFRERFEDDHLADKPRKSQNSYLAALNHFERIIKLQSISHLTSNHVSQFRSELLREDRPHATVTNILTHCRTAFKWAERIGMIHKCPSFQMPRTVKRKLMRGRAIGDDEFTLMLANAGKPFGEDRATEWQRFLWLLRLSGLRIEEASRLSWDAPPIHHASNAGWIQVLLDADPYPCIVFYGEAQKSREDEIAPLTPPLADWLRKIPASERTGLVAPCRGDGGEQLIASNISRAVSEIGEASGVKVNASKFASAHDLRRAFGREWAQKVKPAILQRLMRHKSIATTMAFYAHLESEDIGAALWGKVGGAVGGKPDSSGKQRDDNRRKKRRS